MPSPNPLRLGLGFASICLIWGSTWLAMKEGLETVPPFSSAALRFLLAIVILFMIAHHQKKPLPRDKAFWQLVTETGLLIYGVPFAFIYWGQSQIPSGLSAVMFATFPFFVTIVGRIRIREERLDMMKIIGVVLGFLGIYVVFSGELSFDSTLSPWGMGAVVLSAAMQAFGLITIKKRAHHVHPIHLTLGGIMIGAVFLVIMSIGFESLEHAVFDMKAIVSILYLTVFGTIITFLTYFWLVKHVHQVLLALTAFITPIVALTLGSLVRGEHLGEDLIIGAAMVLTGVLAANGRGLVALMRRWVE